METADELHDDAPPRCAGRRHRCAGRRNPGEHAFQFEGRKCRGLLHASRAEYQDGFADLNVGLRALAKVHHHGAIFAADRVVPVTAARASSQSA
jgi:hypothetical protein